MTTYKLSIIVPDRHNINSIQNLDTEPQLGTIINLNQEEYEIASLTELMPRRNDFVYLQALCRPISKTLSNS